MSLNILSLSPLQIVANNNITISIQNGHKKEIISLTIKKNFFWQLLLCNWSRWELESNLYMKKIREEHEWASIANDTESNWNTFKTWSVIGRINLFFKGNFVHNFKSFLFFHSKYLKNLNWKCLIPSGFTRYIILRNRKHFPCFYQVIGLVHTWRFGRTRNAEGIHTTNKCFHRFLSSAKLSWTFL